MDIDLRDQRGRLTRIAIAIAVGIAVSIAAIAGIGAISPPPNRDPVGGSSVALLAIAIAVMTSLVVLRLLSLIRDRRAHRALRLQTPPPPASTRTP